LINDAQEFEKKGLGSISNRDNVGAKQLKWESNRFSDKRDNYSKGRNDKHDKFGKNDKRDKFGKGRFDQSKNWSKKSDRNPKNNAKRGKKPSKVANKSKKKTRFNRK
jgi:hypothetical protein